jgi:hypothetical protein
MDRETAEPHVDRASGYARERTGRNPPVDHREGSQKTDDKIETLGAAFGIHRRESPPASGEMGVTDPVGTS